MIPDVRVTGSDTARSAIANSTTPRAVIEQALGFDGGREALGTPSCRNSATTATGSVAEIIAPSRNASEKSRPVVTETTTATTPAVISTPGAARTTTIPKVWRSSPRSILYAASNTRPGSSTARISSGVTRKVTSGSRTAIPRPARTSPTE